MEEKFKTALIHSSRLSLHLSKVKHHVQSGNGKSSKLQLLDVPWSDWRRVFPMLRMDFFVWGGSQDIILRSSGFNYKLWLLEARLRQLLILMLILLFCFGSEYDFNIWFLSLNIRLNSLFFFSPLGVLLQVNRSVRLSHRWTSELQV